MGAVEALQDRLRALASVGRIGQFVSVGVAGASLETVIVALLTAGILLDAPLGGQPLLAKAVGAEASISLMFLLNDRWTFAEAGATSSLAVIRRYVRSHLVRIGGITVAFATLYVLTTWVDIMLVVAGGDLWPTVANGIGIGVGMVLNYVAESLLTWRVHLDGAGD